MSLNFAKKILSFLDKQQKIWYNTVYTGKGSDTIWNEYTT